MLLHFVPVEALSADKLLPTNAAAPKLLVLCFSEAAKAIEETKDGVPTKSASVATASRRACIHTPAYTVWAIKCTLTSVADHATVNI